MSGLDPMETARSVALLAKKHGCSDAVATVTRSREVETTWRDGKLEKVSDATSRSAALALYVDGKFGSMDTSDLRPAALERFVADAIALVRALARDPYRRLPDPALYQGRTTADLEIFDPKVAELTMDTRIARARAAEEGARSVKGAERILSVTTGFSDSESEYARVATNGFEGLYRGTGASMNAEVSVKDDDGRRPEDWVTASTCFVADLPDPAVIGREATGRALARLGAKKIASGTLPILVEARAARSLLRQLLGPLGGSALQQKESFLEGKLDKPIASSLFTLRDEPHLRRGIGSRTFDGEGIATKPRVVVDAGTLRSYFLNVYYAGKLGVAPTSGGATNLVVPPGKKAIPALLKDIKEGILVTGFIGGNSNSTTGVFSLGIDGFRIQGGERREPIAEMNLSGNHLELWQKLVAVGDDPYASSSVRTPSLVFDRVAIAGK